MRRISQLAGQTARRDEYDALWIIAVLLLLAAPVNAGVLYVNASATGSADGSSWVDAFTDLQDALALAQVGDEIWMAAGTYKPDRGTGDRKMFFVVPAGVDLYGGFAGWEECLDERDWIANETILSGDLNDDDTPQGCAAFSDCCREHEGPGCEDPACEALVCSGIPQCCNPNYPGGWDYLCWNSAQYACYSCSRHNCENSYRVVTAIGADSSTVFDGFTILGQYASRERDVASGKGAGLFCDSCALTIRNSRFRDNSIAGIIAEHASNITLLGSSFIRNGYGVEVVLSDVTVTDCAFTDNSTGLFVWDGDAIVHESKFARNGSQLSVHGNATLSSSTFEDGGSVRLGEGESTVTDCQFVGNRVHLYINDSAGTVDNCLFEGSTAGSTFIGSRGSVLFRNCAFLNNTPRNFALGWGSGNLYVLNCTIIGNGVDFLYGSGGIYIGEYASAQVLNTIIWGNGGGLHQTREQDQIKVYPGSFLEIDDSIVEGWSGVLGGDGNFGDDPMFADIGGPDDILGTGDDDARLLPGSPAIDAGFPSVYLTPTDLDGHTRVLCGRVDIGAYEFGIGDYNCDQTVNLTDFMAWPGCMTGPLNPVASAPGSDLQSVIGNRKSAIGCEAFDFNADGLVDLLDFAAFQRLGL